MMATPFPDDGIPVLTDVIAEAPADAVALPPAPAPTQVSDDEKERWIAEVSLRVQSRVLAGLLTRIEPMVEEQLRDTLADMMEQVLAISTAELKMTATRIVREAVALAVSAEIAGLPESPRPDAPAHRGYVGPDFP